MNEFKPFENDTQSLNLNNEITIENGINKIIIYGEMSIEKNDNLDKIKSLIKELNNIKEVIENKNKQKLKK